MKLESFEVIRKAGLADPKARPLSSKNLKKKGISFRKKIEV